MEADPRRVLVLFVLLSSSCISTEKRDVLSQNGPSAVVGHPRSSAESAKPSPEQARGPIEAFSGYVEVGGGFTIFEACGSAPKKIFVVANGDVADKLVQQKLVDLGRMEGAFLGSGEGRATHEQGTKGIFATHGSIEFVSFSLADRCQENSPARGARPGVSVESATPSPGEEPGPIETFFGYVWVGEEFTVFEPCGSKVERDFALTSGDAAEKVARRKVFEQGRVDGLVLGSGEGRIVSDRRSSQGPRVTGGTIEFVSFSLADECPK